MEDNQISYKNMKAKGVLPECLYCEKKFPSSSNIKAHVKIHYGLRPYKCSLCNFFWIILTSL